MLVIKHTDLLHHLLTFRIIIIIQQLHIDLRNNLLELQSLRFTLHS